MQLDACLVIAVVVKTIVAYFFLIVVLVVYSLVAVTEITLRMHLA